MLDSKIVIILALSFFLFLFPYLRKDQIRWTTSQLISVFKDLKHNSRDKDNLVVDPDNYLFPEVYEELTTLINKEMSVRINIFITFAIDKHTSLDYYLFELMKGTIENLEHNSITMLFSIEDRVKIVHSEGKTMKIYLADWEIEDGLKMFISSFERKYFNYAIIGMTKFMLDTIVEGRKSLDIFSLAVFIILSSLVILPIIIFILCKYKAIKQACVNLNDFTKSKINIVKPINITSILSDECVICLNKIGDISSKIFKCGHFFHFYT